MKKSLFYDIRLINEKGIFDAGTILCPLLLYAIRSTMLWNAAHL